MISFLPRTTSADGTKGETWNLLMIGYQLKQVRERVMKGLVDKGILRTEKRNFLLFDMATHPVADSGAKEDVSKRVRNVCTNRTVILPPNAWLPEDVEFRYLRTICMVCAAYAANVLENALVTMSHEARERAFAQVDELLTEYSQWPFARRSGGGQAIGANLAQAVNEEVNKAKDRELQLEVRNESHSAGLFWLTRYATGHCGMFERVYKAGFVAVMFFLPCTFFFFSHDFVGRLRA